MKKVCSIVTALTLILILSAFASTASAYTAYTSETDFVSALGPYYLEDFNGYTYDSGPVSLEMGPVNGFGYTITTTQDDLYYLDGAISTSEWAVPPSIYIHRHPG